MTIEIKQGIYTHCLFSFTYGKGDILGGIQQDKEGWFAKVRERVYVDSFISDSSEEEKWLIARIKENQSSEDFIKKILERLEDVAKVFGAKLDILLIENEIVTDEVAEKIKNTEWIHDNKRL